MYENSINIGQQTKKKKEFKRGVKITITLVSPFYDISMVLWRHYKLIFWTFSEQNWVSMSNIMSFISRTLLTLLPRAPKLVKKEKD